MTGDAAQAKGKSRTFSKIRRFFKSKSRAFQSDKCVDSNESTNPLNPVRFSNTVEPSNSEVTYTSDSSLSTKASPDDSLASASESGELLTQLDPFGDRERTEIRYKEAAKQLEESLNIRRANWALFEVPDSGI